MNWGLIIRIFLWLLSFVFVVVIGVLFIPFPPVFIGLLVIWSFFSFLWYLGELIYHMVWYEPKPKIKSKPKKQQTKKERVMKTKWYNFSQNKQDNQVVEIVKHYVEQIVEKVVFEYRDKHFNGSINTNEYWKDFHPTEIQVLSMIFMQVKKCKGMESHSAWFEMYENDERRLELLTCMIFAKLLEETGKGLGVTQIYNPNLEESEDRPLRSFKYYEEKFK